MRSPVSFPLLALVGFAVVAPADASATALLAKLTFVPAAACYGDPIRYAFAYANVPGGLAAVKDVEILADWDGAPERPTRLPGLLPDPDELARSRTASGSFRSGGRFWRPPEFAPKGGAEVAVTSPSRSATATRSRAPAASATRTRVRPRLRLRRSPRGRRAASPTPRRPPTPSRS